MRVCCLLLFAIFLVDCGRSATETANQAAAPSPASPEPTVQSSPLTGFEKDLQFIRNGQFTYVYVFSRKDGKQLDKDDSAFLRTNAPQVVDWVQTGEGKKVIAGTNFNLEEGNFAALKKRFVVEDYTGR
jgi:hypothetical protein